jgi:hypothetical protein
MQQKNHALDQEICVIFAAVGCLKHFHIKNYTTNQNQKGKGCAFKDFILHCVQKMTEPAEREDEKDSVEDESLAFTSTALTPPSPPHKRLPVTDPADRLQGGLKIHKMVHVPQSKKRRKARHLKNVVCSAQKQRRETNFMRLTCSVALSRT